MCFIEGSAEELGKITLSFEVDFIVSQSALEHIKHDIIFFEQQKRIKTSKDGKWQGGYMFYNRPPF